RAAGRDVAPGAVLSCVVARVSDCLALPRRPLRDFGAQPHARVPGCRGGHAGRRACRCRGDSTSQRWPDPRGADRAWRPAATPARGPALDCGVRTRMTAATQSDHITQVTAAVRNPARPKKLWEGLFLVDSGAVDCMVP